MLVKACVPAADWLVLRDGKLRTCRPILKASWALRSGGRLSQHGTSPPLGAGASYGLRVNRAGVPNTLILNDILDLRVVTSLGGTTTVNFERVTRDAGGNFFRTLLESVSFSAAYGGNLANVDFIALGLRRDRPLNGNNPEVHANLRLLDLVGGSIVELGHYDFTDAETIYTNGTFALASARA